METNKGFIQLHRKLTEWEWYEDNNTFKLFIHCLLKANFKDKKWRGNTIKRGQFITSLNSLSAETNLTIQNVRTSLKRLKSTQEVTHQTTSRNTIITVVCYDLYQTSNTTPNKQVTNKQQTTNKQVTTTNNVNNDNNDNNKDINTATPKFSFFNSLVDLGADKNIVNDWIKVRKTKKLTQTQTALKGFLKETKKSNRNLNEILELCVINSWGGFKADWIKEDTNKVNDFVISNGNKIKRGVI